MWYGKGFNDGIDNKDDKIEKIIEKIIKEKEKKENEDISLTSRYLNKDD